MITTDLKIKAHLFCKEYVDSRLARIQNEIKKIKESLDSETKSSAGDKHETGRAMLQLEREKLGQQLLEAEKMKRILDRTKVNSKNGNIGLGSLAKTTKANYFVAISAGRFEIKGIEIFCISPFSPIGKLLLGKSIGESIHFKGLEQVILETL